MKRKFYTALALTIVAGILFMVTNFTNIFAGNKLTDFLQGFSGGLGCGSLIATIAWGIKWKQEKEAQIATTE